MGADPGRGDGAAQIDYGKFDGDAVTATDEAGDSVQMPHWTAPPTGEIPKILAELSSDPPLWMSPRRKALEEALWLESPSQPAELHTVGEARRGRPLTFDESVPPANLPNGRESMQATTKRISSSDVGHRSEVRTDQPGGQRSSDAQYLSEPEGRDESSDFKSRLRQGTSAPRHSRRESPKFKAEGGRSTPKSRRTQKSSRSEPTEGSTGRSTPSGRSATKATVTGLVLGALVVLAALAGSGWFLGLIVVGILAALIEYLELARRGGSRPIGIVAIIATVVAVVGSYTSGFEAISLSVVLAVVFSMVWHLVGLGKGRAALDVSSTLLGVFWIGGLGAFAGMILSPSGAFGTHGPDLLLAALVCTSASDVLAYAGGSVFGRHRIAPKISPSKTAEGLLIGALGSILAGTFIASSISPLSMSKGFLLGLVIAIVAPIGDLAESLMKRDIGVKDSGSLLPGHGGILDRIDGVLFALPFVYYLLRLIHG